MEADSGWRNIEKEKKMSNERQAVQRLAARIYRQESKMGKLPSMRKAEQKAQKIAERADRKKK